MSTRKVYISKNLLKYNLKKFMNNKRVIVEFQERLYAVNTITKTINRSTQFLQLIMIIYIP